MLQQFRNDIRLYMDAEALCLQFGLDTYFWIDFCLSISRHFSTVPILCLRIGAHFKQFKVVCLALTYLEINEVNSSAYLVLLLCRSSLALYLYSMFVLACLTLSIDCLGQSLGVLGAKLLNNSLDLPCACFYVSLHARLFQFLLDSLHATLHTSGHIRLHRAVLPLLDRCLRIIVAK